MNPVKIRCGHGYFDPHCTPHGLGSHFGIVDCEGGCRGGRTLSIPEVVEWLREQGAVDLDATRSLLDAEMRFYGIPFEFSEQAVEAIVDAALRPPVSSSQGEER